MHAIYVKQALDKRVLWIDTWKVILEKKYIDSMPGCCFEHFVGNLDVGIKIETERGWESQ